MSDDVPRPWTQVAVRSQRDYRIFKTRTLDVLDPRNGTAYVRTVIDAPDWVNVIPVTEKGEVVLVRQFRFGTWSNTLEIPGGKPSEPVIRLPPDLGGHRGSPEGVKEFSVVLLKGPLHVLEPHVPLLGIAGLANGPLHLREL